MLSALGNVWKIPELRQKITFTLIMFAVFRMGTHIPVPGVDPTAIEQLFANGNLFGLLDLFSGGAFSKFSIFAMSITPYINAAIIIQLLNVVIPTLEQWSKEGEEGHKKTTQVTRYLTVVLAFFQAIGMAIGLKAEILNPNPVNILIIAITLTAGTVFLMWLGEQINERGVGNGISLIIFAGIVARIPSGIRALSTAVESGSLSIVTLIIFIVAAVFVTAGVVMIQEGQRRIPVQYAKRVVGRKMYGGQSTHIPIKVNQSGVIPIIFALSLLQFPLTITYFLKADSGFTTFVTKWLSPSGMPGVWVYGILNVVLIIFFTYFYTQATFNPVEVADNMKANGGFIPGIRPGKATEEYLQKVMSRITIVGAVFLALIATLPTVLSVIAPESLGSIHFGGTSLLIAVGVALETVRQLENQMLMRNYQGFLK